jgi:hypothetical protein
MTPYPIAYHVIEWQKHQGGFVCNASGSRATVDYLAFNLGTGPHPRPRVWINGEVVQEGEGFNDAPAPRPGARYTPPGTHGAPAAPQHIPQAPDPQQVLKAEGASPDATARGVPAPPFEEPGERMCDECRRSDCPRSVGV